MGFFSALRVALSALVVNKGRSTLTSLGIVIGISAVIALVSAGDGARLLLDEKLETVGKNIIVVRAGERRVSLHRRLQQRVAGIAAIKADPQFTEFKLVRQSRLSVVPVSDEHWKVLAKMAG